MNYRTELDGLRALSLITVILFHAGIPGFAGGFVAVDVFFTLSGFLIPTIVLNDIARDRFSISQFYERRIRRIVPGLIFILLACTPFAFWLLTPAHLDQFGESALAAAFMGSNIYFWTQAGYFGADAELMPWLHTWTLGVEEQFYLIFPLLFALGWKMGWRWIWVVTVSVAVFGLALSEWGAREYPDAAFYLTPFRIWELAFGMTAALIRHDFPLKRDGLIEQLMSLLGLFLIFYASFTYTDETVFPGLHALLPVLGTVLVIMFAAPKALTTRLLKWRPLVFMGTISYSTYLWHQPLFAFARLTMESHPTPWHFSALGLVSVGLGYLTWKFVEVPFRDRKKYSVRAIYGGVTVAFLGLTGVFLGAQAFNGHDYRFDPKLNEIAQDRPTNPQKDQCHSQKGAAIAPQDACRYWHDNTSIVVLGDSHAISPLGGLADLLKDRGEGVAHYSFFAGFPAFTTPQYKARHEWSKAALEHIIAQEEWRDVVLIYRHQTYLDGENMGYYPNQPHAMPLTDLGQSDEERRAAYWQSYTYGVQALLDAGKRVVIVLPIIDLGRDIETALYRGERKGDDVIGVTRAYYEARMARVKKLFAETEFKGDLHFVDPTDFLCDDAYCYAAKDGVAFYRDDDHLNLHGGRLLGQQILSALGRDIATAKKE